MSRPICPPVKLGNRSTSSGNATARASVTRARLMPRIRSDGSPTSRPVAKQISAAGISVTSGFQLCEATRMPVVYAPRPKKAEWPIDSCPV